ncbi:glycosyl hydrolase-related protein [Paenibacillus profundus]|uniref:Glycosyl hydrolase-related protein n=1 Tax=Paenibacillus profundus TaxID=1173085 RepID=A0ABS8YMM6_9BACL|nr:alpha-mannosidase [Paenibacillus profundus]MCE5173075.1 glycosyl hydrolase-related protein [Paenibacillus profundus]
MNTNELYGKLTALTMRTPPGYWGKRILSQLEYMNRVSYVQDRKWDGAILPVVEWLLARVDNEGAITERTALQAESMLAECGPAAKSYTLHCAAHAHLDMNFLWGWAETVSATLNTFRTMLDLLEEYSDYLFSHSQAAAYHIVEQYDPEMLEEIKARVQEGRWEVTASTWVEADKNMPSGESMARQLLYAKTYLSQLFGLDPDSLQIDFEPDTFGHSINVPEALNHSGVKYYYYCRGHNDNGHHLFRWESPSGRSVVAYKEPHWYDSRIEPEMALTVPEFCSRTNMTTMLKVYGVGDHGGGPTRRDIERIRDMQTWPIFPNIQFGTYQQFFALTERIADSLPVIREELNFIFTGCYSSESRIKLANRMSENMLGEAELFGSIASLFTSARYFGEELGDAWKKTCFNQFHDILPGSCVLETREHAMASFQEIMATAGSKKSYAIRKLAEHIDTSAYIVADEDVRESMSEGAGPGVGVHLFRMGASERGRGKTRIFHLFNSSVRAREELAEIVIWDWNGHVDSIQFHDSEGQSVPFQYVDRGFIEHWGHYFLRVLLKVNVPAIGYSTYVMTEKDGDMTRLSANDFYLAEQNLPPIEKYEFVLENAHLTARFDTQRFTITSLIDKHTNREYIDPANTAGVFRFIEEDTFNGGGNAWLVGRYRHVEPLIQWNLESCEIGEGFLRQSITIRTTFRSSKLKVIVSLDRDSCALNYKVECDWHEIGKKDQNTPQLNFYMPVKVDCKFFKYDVPFGTIDREGMEFDVPGNSFVAAIPTQRDVKRSVMLLTDSKYGFRSDGQAMAITLLRSSHSPDPYPEVGMHNFQFAVCLTDYTSTQQMLQESYHYQHPLEAVSVRPSRGILPLVNSFVTLERGQVSLAAIKVAERSAPNRWIVRLYETEGEQTTVSLKFSEKVKNAYFVSIVEQKTDGVGISINGSNITFDVDASSLASICVEFDCN